MLLSLLLLIGGGTAPARAVNTELPELGSSAAGLMTPKRERQLGKAFMRSIRRSQQVMDDPMLTDYIQALGRKLVKDSGLEGTPFSFFLVDEPQINAFAGPGGYIGIYTGLILTTHSESELASVLAHEMAHVTQQHLLRAWETASNMALPNAAVLLAAVLLGAAVGGDAGLAAALGGQAALLQQQINFTRSNEKEADRVGIEILAKAGYEPLAMPTFFSRMSQANRVYASSLPEFLMTHPVTTSRTADALGRAEQFPYRQAPLSLRYQMVRANLTQRRIEHADDAISELTLMLEDGRYRNRIALEYGIALAKLRAGRHAAARSDLARLNREQPDSVELAVALAKAEAADGDSRSALQRLDRALAVQPSSYALAFTYAEIALQAGDAASVASRLGLFRQFHADEPRVYKLLSEAEGKLGREAAGHEYLAEYYYLSGDLARAVRQLKIALELPEIAFYDASRLESRLTEIELEQKEEDRRGSGRK